MDPGHPSYQTIKKWSLKNGVVVPAIKTTKKKASLANKQKGKGNRYNKAARTDHPMKHESKVFPLDTFFYKKIGLHTYIHTYVLGCLDKGGASLQLQLL